MDKPAKNDYPLTELIARRWSPRAFDGQPVPTTALRSALEAARWSASCFNEQPWRYIVARRDDPENFERAVDCLSDGNKPWAPKAGALLISVARTTFSHNDKPNRHAWHDVGQASALFTIQALSEDLWVHQMAGFSADRARESFGIPEGFEPVAMMAVGRQGDASDLPEKIAERERAPRSRRTQDEFVFTGTWGRKAEW